MPQKLTETKLRVGDQCQYNYDLSRVTFLRDGQPIPDMGIKGSLKLSLRDYGEFPSFVTLLCDLLDFRKEFITVSTGESTYRFIAK